MYAIRSYYGLLATALLEPADRVVARVLEFGPMVLNEDWLGRKIRQASRLRSRCIDLEATDAYRLINAEGDGLPGLTVDRYGNYLMVQLYAKSWRPHRALLTRILQEEFHPQGISEKDRPQQTRELAAQSDHKKYSTLLTGTGCSGRFQVRENGLNYSYNFV